MMEFITKSFSTRLEQAINCQCVCVYESMVIHLYVFACVRLLVYIKGVCVITLCMFVRERDGYVHF